MLANDPSWADRLRDGVRGGLSAEASIDRTRREHRARLESARDAYLRERLHDLEDLDNRLLRILGGNTPGAHLLAAKGEVLIARRLGPAELLEYRNTGLGAIALEESAATSHAAIVARALGIPAIGGVESLTTDIENGDPIIVDAEEGIVHLRPGSAVTQAYKTRMTLRKQRQATYKRLRNSPARTKDDVDVTLMLNAGLRLDLDHLDVTGAEGVGLFRTEFQFLLLNAFLSCLTRLSFISASTIPLVVDRSRSEPSILAPIKLCRAPAPCGKKTLRWVCVHFALLWTTKRAQAPDACAYSRCRRSATICHVPNGHNGG